MPKVLGVQDGVSGGESGFTRGGVRETSFSLVYNVLSDNLTQTQADIIATTGIPPLYYPTGGAYVKSHRPREVSTVIHPITGVKAILWEVEVEFDSGVDPSGGTAGGTPPAPPARRPKVRWSGDTEEEVLDKDVDTDEPIQTEAGEPILLMSPTTLHILEITRYEPYPFDPNTQHNYANHINKSTFWGAPAGCAWMQPIEVDEETIEGVLYCSVTYTIKFKIKKGPSGAFKDNTWRSRILHHGSKFRPAAAEPAQVAVDENNNPITVNLDYGGIKLPDGDPPVYLVFNRLHRADFNALSLGPF